MTKRLIVNNNFIKLVRDDHYISPEQDIRITDREYLETPINRNHTSGYRHFQINKVWYQIKD